MDGDGERDGFEVLFSFLFFGCGGLTIFENAHQKTLKRFIFTKKKKEHTFATHSLTF